MLLRRPRSQFISPFILQAIIFICTTTTTTECIQSVLVVVLLLLLHSQNHSEGKPARSFSMYRKAVIRLITKLVITERERDRESILKAFEDSIRTGAGMEYVCICVFSCNCVCARARFQSTTSPKGQYVIISSLINYSDPSVSPL